jgi:shikimate kinase
MNKISGPAVSERLALVGFMGCGKSSIGRILATRRGLRYVDLDTEIEQEEGCSISDIFAEKGEAGFRAIESRMLEAVSLRKGGMLLSCGGGVILAPENRRILQERFLCIWIDVPEGELLSRLEHQRAHRPLLHETEYRVKVHCMLEARNPLYREAGRFTYSWKNGDSPEDSARLITAFFESACQTFPAETESV